MKRTHLNALIDALAFVAFLLLLTTGLLLEFQLPSGSGGLHGSGSGRGAADRSIQLVWGWTRHEWGQVHYWIALAMMAVLAFHLLLHWKWIVCTVRGKPGAASGRRLILGAVGLCFTVLLSVAPLMSETSAVSRSELRESRAEETEPAIVQDASDFQPQETSEHSTSIRGSMTLRQISTTSGVSVAELTRELGLPPNTDPDAGAGRLMRQHGLTMNDLRRAVTSAVSRAEPTPER